jgi:transcriptional regulator with XRE-family HTH domain
MMRQPDFGKELSKIRNLKGMTQDELALKCNVTIRTIQRIESGIVNPRSYTVKAIGEILDFDFLSVDALRDESSYAKEDTYEGDSTAYIPKEQNPINVTSKKMNQLYLISALLILVLSWSFFALSETNAKMQNPSKSKDNIVMIYSSQSNKSTFDYRFKDANFSPLIKQHKYRLIQDITNHWINTNIILDGGKTYYFMVNGLASTSSKKTSLWIGPEGKANKYDGLPMYSVIGKIGNDQPFYIGTHTEVKPKNDELFYLGYNDDMLGDNIGYYVVDIFEGTADEIEILLKEQNIKIGNYYKE